MGAAPEYHEYFEYRRYPLRRPRIVDGADPVRHPVAIVGGGPIGLALALGLARHGVRSVLIEADDTVTYGSRAACISRRSLEILDQLGVAREVLDQALPWTAGTSYYRDVPVYRLQMPMDENQRFAPMV
ncbi:MAG TPA: FAD-dependent monooxygenase, partial [Burkholderiales bacterium]|nr:FAD-dependent monooxygenase [Burkholderiales bacterium]